MGTFDREVGALIAMASVTGTDGTATLNRGFGTITRTGVGVYELTYDNLGSGSAPLPLADDVTVVISQTKGTQAAMSTTQHVSDTVTRVRTFTIAGGVEDVDFDVSIYRRTN